MILVALAALAGQATAQIAAEAAQQFGRIDAALVVRARCRR